MILVNFFVFATHYEIGTLSADYMKRVAFKEAVIAPEVNLQITDQITEQDSFEKVSDIVYILANLSFQYMNMMDEVSDNNGSVPWFGPVPVAQRDIEHAESISLFPVMDARLKEERKKEERNRKVRTPDGRKESKRRDSLELRELSPGPSRDTSKSKRSSTRGSRSRGRRRNQRSETDSDSGSSSSIDSDEERRERDRRRRRREKRRDRDTERNSEKNHDHSKK